MWFKDDSGWIMKITLLASVCSLRPSLGQDYNDTKAIFDNLLSDSVYNAKVRPIRNQSQPITVTVGYEVLSIVEIDDVGMKFVCNGFLSVLWDDEKLVWNPDDYGGANVIHPGTSQIWKPEILLLNTRDDRDIFEDDNAPLTVTADGAVIWMPGKPMTTACQLDMTYYPFDKQDCPLTLVAMQGNTDEMVFVTLNSSAGIDFYVPNGEWDLVSSMLLTDSVSNIGIPLLATRPTSAVLIVFTLERRPVSILLNIVLPVVFLSFLNVMTFLIPVDSGEKISYSVTVLLAVSVYLSALSSLLPTSSDTQPLLTIYLFSLLVLGMIVVVMTIIVVLLYNLEVKKVVTLRATSNFKDLFRKTNILRRAVSSMELKTTTQEKKHGFMNDLRSNSVSPVEVNIHSNKSEDEDENREDTAHHDVTNPYRNFSRNINIVSFVVFLLTWSALTAGFIIKLSTA